MLTEVCVYVWQIRTVMQQSVACVPSRSSRMTPCDKSSGFNMLMTCPLVVHPCHAMQWVMQHSSNTSDFTRHAASPVSKIATMTNIL
eukprot:scaffold4948_cov84-Cylindrotheca_fusiformis.AAC.1